MLAEVVTASEARVGSGVWVDHQATPASRPADQRRRSGALGGHEDQLIVLVLMSEVLVTNHFRGNTGPSIEATRDDKRRQKDGSLQVSLVYRGHQPPCKAARPTRCAGF